MKCKVKYNSMNAIERLDSDLHQRFPDVDIKIGLRDQGTGPWPLDILRRAGPR